MVVQLQDGQRIHYLAWAGGPARPVVLVHGLARTAWTWLPVGRRLAGAHPVVAPDLRGHGASDAPLQGYELESLALDVLTVVAGSGWGEAVEGPPVIVAGHGLGAMIAVGGLGRSISSPSAAAPPRCWRAAKRIWPGW